MATELAWGSFPTQVYFSAYKQPSALAETTRKNASLWMAAGRDVKLGDIKVSRVPEIWSLSTGERNKWERQLDLQLKFWWSEVAVSERISGLCWREKARGKKPEARKERREPT